MNQLFKIILILASLSFCRFFSNLAYAQTAGPMIADHQAVNRFDQLSDSQIAAAAALKMVIYHASIGENIKEGLNDLRASNSKYNWSNWTFINRQNPDCNDKISNFETAVNSQINNYHLFTMKLCFVDVPGYNCPGGYTVQTLWDLYRTTMERLENQNPSKKFIWWTMPVTTEGHSFRDGFNDRVRSYYSQNNKILFDISDIESNGRQCTSGQYETMCPSYTDDGGHLDGTGRVRVAKALWWLMAQIAGGGPTLTPRPSATPTRTPTPTVKPGDLNRDGRVDISDLVIVGSNFGKNTSSGDANGDGVVNINDLVIVGSNFGR